MGHGAGRHARWPQAALHHRRPARCGASLLRHVGRRRARVARRGAQLGRWSKAWKWWAVSTRRPSPSTTHNCVRLALSNPDRLYRRNHCGIYRLDRPWRHLAAHRPQRCPSASATSASRWSCTRTIPTPPGCSRWTAPTSAAHRARRTPAAYVTLAGGRTRRARPTACARGAGPWTIKRQAMTADAEPPRALPAPPAASCGSGVTRARAGQYRSTCRIYAVEVAGGMSADPRRAALCHARLGGRGRGRHAG